ncbi:TrmH family RNA methyltransferase [Candidatus Spongiisocius sp.]|uniref:TrmH family RNA methyltransferase n=1 Tax=Candidatus Spongiisocius sp. TaxID=3101273 RepID=UPI003B59489C
MITSPTNPKVKRLVRLRSRRHRDSEGAFLIEGYRELARATDAGIRIDEIYVCDRLFLGTNEPELVDRIVASGARCHRLAPGPFRKAAYRDRPEGLLAVAPQFDTGLERIRLGPDPLLLVMEGIEKPGNLGTMLRTADAAGVNAVIVADPTTDPFNPNVVRASLGCLFTVPLAVSTTESATRWMAEHGIKALVTTPSAPDLYWHADYSGAAAVVVGSEQYGLSERWLDGRFPKARIPMDGSADSLNAATAAALVLFEAIRRRRSTSDTPS